MERPVRRRRRAQGQGGGRHIHRGRVAGGRRPGPCRQHVPAAGGAHAAAAPRPRRRRAADTRPLGRLTGGAAPLPLPATA
ncbi:Adenosylhomocysteinase [Actinacidiphila bryophytorum]|uniref:Adenosylhomocysteinase n=1 Tax=Actinacidiphila bryophytorum TaxID=1436133 RepID=A0A9W4EDM0_9ACTN|nr:Adenosylhomocysteinase [Actinacidiphila bryophytorum]